MKPCASCKSPAKCKAAGKCLKKTVTKQMGGTARKVTRKTAMSYGGTAMKKKK